jgi:hypothetical protein
MADADIAGCDAAGACPDGYVGVVRYKIAHFNLSAGEQINGAAIAADAIRFYLGLTIRLNDKFRRGIEVYSSAGCAGDIHCGAVGYFVGRRGDRTAGCGNGIYAAYRH